MINMSVTQKNTLIDKISVILQKARIILVQENISKNFSCEETRKIVLILILECIIGKKSINTLGDVISDFQGNKWLIDFLRLDNEDIILSNTYIQLQECLNVQEWQELVCYAFETFEYSAEQFLSMPVKKGIHIASDKKKSQGIYYTPTDVVDFMIDTCCDKYLDISSKEPITYLDCSCGTAVFLLNILRKWLKKQEQEISKSQVILFVKQAIWGIDISEVAIDNCKITFMIEYLTSFSWGKKTSDEFWEVLTKNFVCGDATNMEVVLKNNCHFPKKFSCIIGNPPYVTLEKKGNLFIDFVDNMMKYSADYSCSSLVLPLSVCYSQVSSFVNLRSRILGDDASWYFYNFDRSPDSLFGDQVKTRNTIIFRVKGRNKGQKWSTNLQRWASENRNGLFKRIEGIDITNCFSKECIPKISSDIERYALCKIRAGEKKLSNMMYSCAKMDKDILTINGTAYNWICAYDHIPPSYDEEGNMYIPNSMLFYGCKEKADLYFIIAMLSNRIAYWYWTVIGDGFHLNNSYLKQLGFHKDIFSKEAYSDIVSIGEEYCKEVRKNVQMTYNCKKCIINYNHIPLLDKIAKIEGIVVKELGIPKEFCDFLEKWYNKHIECGRQK